jgi:hypothetical protein
LPRSYETAWRSPFRLCHRGYAEAVPAVPAGDSVPSASFRVWQSQRARQLDEIEAAHAAVGGSARGRRWATEQINHAYAVLLSSQFQGFCRDLHSESVDLLVRISPASVRNVLRAEFLFARSLDRGTANPANIESDFKRLGVPFWLEVQAFDRRNSSRRRLLEQLSHWRNAIAHQDFASSRLTPSRLRLGTVRGWRRACNGLARSFDRVLNRYLGSLLGATPW